MMLAWHYFVFENILSLYFDIYVCAKIHRWACSAPDQFSSKATVSPS